MELSTSKMKTADFSHITTEDYNHVYEPSEDTFLLIDALETDLDTIQSIKPSQCLEIGSGSGVVLTSLAIAIGKELKYFATDINSCACNITQQTGKHNGIDIITYCCDLVSGLPNELYGTIDILVFNPPYVVTPSNEVASGDLEHTWAGGIDGREVMDRLFPCISKLLSKNGLFYLVALNENKIDDIIQLMSTFGLYGTCILSRKCRSERLNILRFSFNL